MVKKGPAFQGAVVFNAVCKRHYRPHPGSHEVISYSYTLTPRRAFLKLLSHVGMNFPPSPFFQNTLSKILYEFLLLLYVLQNSLILSAEVRSSNNTCTRLQIMMFLDKKFSQNS